MHAEEQERGHPRADSDVEAQPVSDGAHGFAPVGWTVKGGTLQVLVFNPSTPWYPNLGPGQPITGTMDGPDVVAFAGDDRGSIEQASSVVAAPPAPGTFADVVVTHAARPEEAGKPIAVRITAEGDAGPTGYLDVDNVRLRLLPV